jgi:hypothetical protein
VSEYEERLKQLRAEFEDLREEIEEIASGRTRDFDIREQPGRALDRSADLLPELRARLAWIDQEIEQLEKRGRG